MKTCLFILLILAQSVPIFGQKNSGTNPASTNKNAPLDAILADIQRQLENVSNRNNTGYKLTNAELSLITTKGSGAEGSIGLFDVVDLGGSISKEETQTMTFSFEQLPQKKHTLTALTHKELADRILEGIETYKAILDKGTFPGLGTGSFTFTIEFTVEKEATGEVNLWIIKVGGKKGWAKGHSLSLTFKKE